MIPKLNIGNKQTTWSHHRSGWQYAINSMSLLHNANGIRFEGWADGFFSYNNEIIKKPWTGFLHNTPAHPEDTEEKYTRMKSLSKIFQSHTWLESLPYCKGIFVLSKYVEEFIKLHSTVPITNLTHPIELCDKTFSFEQFLENKEKRLITLGHWMRNFNNFYKLKPKFKKTLLKIKEAKGTLSKMDNKYKNNNITTISYVRNEEFDDMFCKNIVFLELYDVSACNTILDCIARNTPILTNRLAASEEYLGKDYPFFFENVEEINDKLNDLDLIYKTTTYLKNLNKSKFTKDHFVNSIVKSNVYKNIKICLF